MVVSLPKPHQLRCPVPRNISSLLALLCTVPCLLNAQEARPIKRLEMGVDMNTQRTSQNDIMRLGHSIYVEFGAITVILGGLLFLSMVGVICLTFEYAKSFTKRQYIYEQHAANHTIIIVS